MSEVPRIKSEETAVETYRVSLRVADRGDHRVLGQWLDERADYEVSTGREALERGDFDACILDLSALAEHRSRLHQLRDVASAPLPVLLLVPEVRADEVARQLRRDYTADWELVDALLRTPVSEGELETQLETLLRTRQQARTIAWQAEQLRTIRDKHAGHGVVITDRAGTIEYVNEAFERQSGYDREAVVGENPRVLQSGEHEESFYEGLWETILAGEVWSGEVINERRNGDQYVIDQTIVPETDDTGEIVRFVAINHEITELKALQKRLRDRGEQLALLNRLLRHDVRNDMTVIVGWGETLADHVDDDGEAIRKRMVEAADHVIDLTETARDLSEALDSDVENDLEDVALRGVLEAEIERRQAQFEHADIAFEGTIPDVTVKADQLLDSVFRNLVNNAVQHHDRDTPTVRIGVEDRDEGVVVSVTDDGPGIPEYVAKSIFEKKSKGLTSAGTGMGLYLVDRLCRAYGAEIAVEDAQPRGTRFEVVFPESEDE
ncbi:MAG: ATP-binding protein [Halodesulfurarchaeum sp.]